MPTTHPVNDPALNDGVPAAYTTGPLGMHLVYKGKPVRYLLPGDYQPGIHLVSFMDGTHSFANRAQEILLWGALCAKAGIALLEEMERTSFPGHPLSRTLHEFVYNASSTVEYYFGKEHLRVASPDVYTALGKKIEQITVVRTQG